MKRKNNNNKKITNMKSKRVINEKLSCIGTQVPGNGAKNLLAFFAFNGNAPITHVASHKYIVLSQGTCGIHDNKYN